MCNLLHFFQRVTDPRHRSVDIYEGHEVQEKLDVSHLKRIHPSPVCAFCVCVCFVARPSMLLIRVGLYCDPARPERKIKLSPNFVIFLLPLLLDSEVQPQRARRVNGLSGWASQLYLNVSVCVGDWVNESRPFFVAKHCWEQKNWWVMCEMCACVCVWGRTDDYCIK